MKTRQQLISDIECNLENLTAAARQLRRGEPSFVVCLTINIVISNLALMQYELGRLEKPKED